MRRATATASQQPVEALEPPVFIDEMAEVLGTSVRTLERMLRAKTFPIPELPTIDRRHRWSRAVVRQWLAEASSADRPGTHGRPRLVRR